MAGFSIPPTTIRMETAGIALAAQTPLILRRRRRCGVMHTACHDCQSGVWNKAQGSGGTGLRGVYYPLRGKSIICSAGEDKGAASVDASGNLNVGFYDNGRWTWCGAVGSCGGTDVTPAGIKVTEKVVSINEAGGTQTTDGEVCTVSWPAT